ncbi:MAG: single-stranded-DNA-specific exonuclease RecJ [Planctomycetes bacterium]|nr:single-stranded-DNA-specific exonuclease RecJ [Planctomycetota bacterium]
MGDWLIKAEDHPEHREQAQQLARRLGLNPVTGRLLLHRGIDGAEDARAFLDPALSALHDPFLLPGIEAGVTRLLAAVEAKEPILLFGDYDVDGTTGAIVLQAVLRKLGGVVEAHIPDRSEGYGVNVPRMERAAAEGVKVVVTIDNGIAAVDEAARIRELGLDLIVVDHHTFSETLPVAHALIHPRLPDSAYPNPHLCGAGVAFKVGWALAARAGGGKVQAPLRELLLQLLSIAALGTIADVVQLVGENRAIVRYGLRALRAAPFPGVRALLELAKLEGVPSAMDVSFKIAPRLNAAGRMGSARRAFDLLVTDDPAEAQRLALELDEENKRRRDLQARVFKEACAAVEEAYGEAAETPGIVVWGDDWPHGVVGIVAAKLCETYGRPTLCISVETKPDGTQHAKGSGRSVADVDLLAALEGAAEHLTRYGGHAAAVGCSLEVEKLELLRAAFAAGVLRTLDVADDTPWPEVAARLEGYEVVADLEVRLDELDRQLLDELERLAPFGCGNDEPLFTVRGVRLVGEPRLMGKTGRHVAFMIRQGEQVLRTVAWSRPELWDELRERSRPGPHGPQVFDVAFRPRLNRFRGQAKVELELSAIRFAEAPQPVAPVA